MHPMKSFVALCPAVFNDRNLNVNTIKDTSAPVMCTFSATVVQSAGHLCADTLSSLMPFITGVHATSAIGVTKRHVAVTLTHYIKIDQKTMGKPQDSSYEGDGV